MEEDTTATQDRVDAQSTDDATGTNGGNERTFTQADVDRMFSDRLSRERRKLTDEVKASVRKQVEDEQQRKQQEEASEFKPLYEKALEDKTAAEKRADDVAAQFRSRLSRVEIEKAAKESRLAAPNVAHRLIDFEKITFNDDGEPINITALVQKLATDYPDLVKPESNERNGIERTPEANGSASTDYASDYVNKIYGRK